MDERTISLAHIENTLEFAETICGRDDRKQVNSRMYPFKLLCRLIITAKNEVQYVAAVFFISARCVITSEHCVHVPVGSNAYDWAKSIPNKCVRVQGYMFQRWSEWARL